MWHQPQRAAMASTIAQVRTVQPSPIAELIGPQEHGREAREAEAILGAVQPHTPQVAAELPTESQVAMRQASLHQTTFPPMAAPEALPQLTLKQSSAIAVTAATEVAEVAEADTSQGIQVRHISQIQTAAREAQPLRAVKARMVSYFSTTRHCKRRLNYGVYYPSFKRGYQRCDLKGA